MFHFINSIPLWIRLILLLISEIILIFEFIKNKYKFSKSFKNFFLLMIILIPVAILGMIVNRYNELGLVHGTAQNIANIFPVIIGLFILVGLVTTAIMRLKEGNLTVVHRNVFILGLVCVFLGIFLFLMGWLWL